MNSGIKNINIYSSISKNSRSISDSTHNISEIKFYIIEIITTNNIKGQGYLLSFDYSEKAIEGALLDIKKFILDRKYKIYETVKFKEEYENESEYFGNIGLLKWAESVVNIAMWDAWGKTLKMPIWKILGNNVKKIPIYGSGGWLNYSEEELIGEALNYKARGFKAIKVKVGSKDINRDISRVAKVREKIGKDMLIMIDANQGMNSNRAIQLFNAIRNYDIFWFEEPVNNMDILGYEKISKEVGINIAMGEREYSTSTMMTLIEKNALDLWQPDIIRIGGVESWRNSAALANNFGIPCLPHYYKDYDVPLLTTINNPFGAESFDWVDEIIDNDLLIEDGFAYPREGAGWGFNFLDNKLNLIG